MDFSSDNVSAVSPAILQALVEANAQDVATPYGEDAMSMSLHKRFSDLFGREAKVFPVVSGTAANALALSACVQPWQAVICEEKAHIHVMECCAPEFYTGGAKILPALGREGRLNVSSIDQAVRYSGKGCLHRSQAGAISLTQSSDLGTVYRRAELDLITASAREQQLFIHMDGARFANAVAFLQADPADLVKGVDVLTFGASKNGAMNAEAVVIFNPELARDFSFRVKRAGHALSKARYLAAQLHAYLEGGLWLENARHANQAATYLAAGLSQVEGLSFRAPVETNLLFLEWEAHAVTQLQDLGVVFYAEPVDEKGRQRFRLACSFNTSREQIDALLSLFAAVAGWQRKAA